ncbi:MAG: 3-methyl-2-oxobutanoate hydroxymethyltransferase [Candidatus Bipolaricaulota bacterium]|nr:MAG: 3-methyl-2-oxobutanoate hydroxymethyltransferase [Candidatus Bipolaricaulota bacterium]
MRVTIDQIRKKKARGERFAALTAYDVVTARLVDEAGIPLILVGDSLGMVVLGYDSTIPVTLDDIVHHTRAVVRGSRKALIVADLPFMTYHKSPEQALESAGRCLQEGGAQAVKLEGGRAVAETVARLTASGIPVMGHLGLTPQSIHQLGGFKAQGKDVERARELLGDAHALEEAGAFAIVLECVPAELSRLITERLTIPTVGIGAGPFCDAEIQVVSDTLGWFSDFVPKHAKQFAKLADAAAGALAEYVNDVEAGRFPTEKESVPLSEDVLRALEEGGGGR